MDLSNWLFGEIDRERLLDMDRRLRPVRRNTLGVLAATLMISAPWTGWWTLAPLVVAAGLFALAGRRGPQGSHPEYAIFGAWVMAEAMIAGSVALTGVTIGAISWLAMRVHLRAFDLAYRIGGEEFVVMLPGADLRQTAALAQDLRAAVLTETDGGGQLVTMSCGVSASVRGEPFRYGEVFAAADAALYEAKRTGRDRVCVAATRGLGSSALASVQLPSIRRSHAIAKTSRG
jgi:hypothetical protein